LKEFWVQFHKGEQYHLGELSEPEYDEILHMVVPCTHETEHIFIDELHELVTETECNKKCKKCYAIWKEDRDASILAEFNSTK